MQTTPRALAYKTARRIVRDNGTTALRWLPGRIAGAFRYLANQLPDDLADKASYTGPGLASPISGNQWRKHPDVYRQAKADALRTGRRFAVYVRTEKALCGGAA